MKIGTRATDFYFNITIHLRRLRSLIHFCPHLLLDILLQSTFFLISLPCHLQSLYQSVTLILFTVNVSPPLSDCVGEIQLKTKSPSTEILSTNVVEKREHLDYCINIKLECDVHHRLLSDCKDRKKSHPFM